ncbi:hypothetical protein BU16DRAFT_576661, partial [Lophium mytilinum]
VLSSPRKRPPKLPLPTHDSHPPTLALLPRTSLHRNQHPAAHTPHAPCRVLALDTPPPLHQPLVTLLPPPRLYILPRTTPPALSLSLPHRGIQGQASRITRHDQGASDIDAALADADARRARGGAGGADAFGGAVYAGEGRLKREG